MRRLAPADERHPFYVTRAWSSAGRSGTPRPIRIALPQLLHQAAQMEGATLPDHKDMHDQTGDVGAALRPGARHVPADARTPALKGAEGMPRGARTRLTAWLTRDRARKPPDPPRGAAFP